MNRFDKPGLTTLVYYAKPPSQINIIRAAVETAYTKENEPEQGKIRLLMDAMPKKIIKVVCFYVVVVVVVASFGFFLNNLHPISLSSTIVSFLPFISICFGCLAILFTTK